MKGSGKPDDRKGHVRFDVAGAGNGFTVRLVRHRQTKETEQIGFTYGTPRQSSTLRPGVFEAFVPQQEIVVRARHRLFLEAQFQLEKPASKLLNRADFASFLS